MSPGGVFVVEGAVSEAAVEDADESVGEGSEGSVVGVAGCSSGVVERAGAGAGVERGEGPEVAGVCESSVAGVAGEDDSVFA